MPDHVWGQGLWDQAHWDSRTADQGALTLTGGSAALRLGRGEVLTLIGKPAILDVTRGVPSLPQVWHMGRRQRYLLGPWVSR
jgi:hypothetical protein